MAIEQHSSLERLLHCQDSTSSRWRAVSILEATLYCLLRQYNSGDVEARKGARGKPTRNKNRGGIAT